MQDAALQIDLYNNGHVSCTAPWTREQLDGIIDIARQKGLAALRFWCENDAGLSNVTAIRQRGAKFYSCGEDWVLLDLALAGPSPPPGPTFVGGVVVSVKDGLRRRRLLVKEKFGDWSGLWKCPTGVIRRNESPLECAVRKVKEEVGVISRRHGVFHVRWRKFSTHNDVIWFVTVDADSLLPLSVDGSQLTDARWFSESELDAADDVLPLARDWQKMETERKRFAPLLYHASL